MNTTNHQRRISVRAKNMIKQFEGLRLEAYLCPGGILTIGFGHTKNVRVDQRINEMEANALLDADLQRFEQAVTDYVDVPLHDNQFGALVSFCFNVGVAMFARSTLLQLLNRGWYQQVPAQLLRWNRVAGREVAGLMARRKEEVRLWSLLPTPEDMKG